MLIEFAHLNSKIATLCLQMLFNVQKQNLVQLRDGFGRPVILSHQDFTGSLLVLAFGGALGLVAKCFCQGMLQIKYQAIFSPLGQQMKPCTNKAEHSLVAFNLLDF